MKIRINGLDFEIEDENISKALEKERADSEELLKDVEAKATAAQARADSAEDKNKKLSKELETFKAEQIKRDRAELVTQAQGFSKDLKISDDAKPEEIRRVALEARGIKLDDKSDDYIRFRFEHELEQLQDHTPVDKIREVLYDDKEKIVNRSDVFSIDRGWR